MKSFFNKYGSAVEIIAASLSSMIFALGAGNGLSLEGFGIFGTVILVAGLAVAVVQGGFVDGLLQQDDPGHATKTFNRIDVFLLPGVTAALMASAVLHDGLLSVVLSSTSIVFLAARASCIRAVALIREQPTIILIPASVLLVGASSCAVLGYIAPEISLSSWLQLHASVSLMSSLLSVALLRSRSSKDPNLLTTPPAWNWKHAAESALLVGGTTASTLVATPALGLTFAAGVRGATTLFGPLSVLQSILRLFAIRAFARSSEDVQVRIALRLVLLAVGASMIWISTSAVALFWSPIPIFGASTEAVQDLFAWQAAGALLQTVYIVLFSRARARSDASLVRQCRMLFVLGAAGGAAAAVIVSSVELYFLIVICGQLAAVIWASVRLTRGNSEGIS